MVAALGAIVSGCVTTPIIPAGEQGQIVDVKVTKTQAQMGTRNLEEDVRVKTQNAAYRFSEVGPELYLDVKIIGFQGPSAAMAFFISTGTSSIIAEVAVTNLETDKTYEPKTVLAANPRMGGIIGAIQAGTTDPIADERSLTSKLAEAIMKQVYGDEAVKRAATRTASRRTTANYPVSYEEESQRYECARIRVENERAVNEAEAEHEDPRLKELPSYCDAHPATS